jgi:hypothetical protein
MRIVHQRPPMFSEIAAAFPEAYQPGVIFAWGDVIYNPTGGPIEQELIAHEAVHGERQKAMGIEEWWHRYIAEPQFRVAEEIPAHRAEYRRYCQLQRDRDARARALHRMAIRLASDLYGQIITYMAAKRAIKGTA